MKIVLCSAPNLGSLFLRVVLMSRWSHVAVLDEETGVVYDATITGKGCRAHAWAGFQKRYPTLELRHTEVLDLPRARAWLAEQLGKPYDWRALIGFAFRRAWQDGRAWFCSEHAAAFVNQFDSDGPWFNAAAGRITPNHFQVIHRGLK